MIMSLPDTAEYWWDVKQKYTYKGKTWVHFIKSPCGHFKPGTRNSNTSKFIENITCPACLKLLKANGNIYNLKKAK